MIHKNKILANLLLLWAVIFVFMFPVLSSAEEKLIIDSHLKNNFIRLMFYSQTPVNFKSDLEGDLLKIKFNKKMSFELNEVPEELQPYLSSVYFKNNGDFVNIKLKDADYNLRQFVGENFVGIDLVKIQKEPVRKKASVAKPKAVLKKVYELAAEEVKVEQPDNEAPDSTANAKTEEISTEAASIADTVEGEIKTSEQSDVVKDKEIADEDVGDTLNTAEGEADGAEDMQDKDRAEDKKDSAAIDKKAAEDDEEGNVGDSKIDDKDVFVYEPPGEEKAKEILVMAKDIPTIDKITFNWSEFVGASIFVRGDYLWVIFDKSQPFDVDKIIKKNATFFESGEQIKNKHYSILRFKLAYPINVIAYRDNDDWVVGITDKEVAPPDSPKFDITYSDLHGSSVVIERDGEVHPIRFLDPDIGDEIIAVPYTVEGRGVATIMQSIDFVVLKTAQGLAIQLNADDVNYKVSNKSIDFAGPTNKLFGGAQAALREQQEKERLAKLREEELRNQSKEPTIVKFKTWKKNGDKKFLKDLAGLNEEILNVNWSKKSAKRLDLARFYITHGMSAEALGIIAIIQEYDKDFGKTNDVKMLEGVSQYFLGRYNEAMAIFENLDYKAFDADGRSEAEFWRAATSLKLGDQVQMDKFISKNPTKNEDQNDLTSGDKVEVTRLMLETSSRLLKMIRQVDPDFANQEEVQTLESTAKFVTSHYRETIKRFEETDLYKSGDVFEAEEEKLWWGTSGFKHSIKYNLTFLENVGKFLKYYPDNVYNDFALLALEEKIEANDITSAEEILDLFREEPREVVNDSIEYFRGLFYAKDEEDELAISTWKKLDEKVFDRFNRARAKFALTVFLLQKRQIDLKESVDRLESLRSTWRGDVLELNILKLIGDLYMDRKQYLQGFQVWRELVSTFPGSEEALLVAKGMSEKFIQLFNEGYADEMPKVDALTLFYEFRELTPIGKLGDDMIQRLSDRLIELDLLGRAAALLTHQVRFRLTGEEKDRASTKLAEVHMMDNKPQLAFDVLNATEHSAMDEEIALQRKYLKANALIELGRNNQVLSLLQSDESHKASFLRAEVYWRNKVWKKVIDELETPFRELRRDEKKLTEEQSEHLIRLAVAYAIVERKKRLQILYEDFIPFMADDIKSKMLTFVASDNGAVDFRDIESTVGYSDIETFLKKYLESARMPTDTSVEPAPDDAAETSG